MANDYQRILRTAQAINALPDPEQQPDTIDPALWLNTLDTNIEIFAQNNPVVPVNRTNFGLLGNISGLLLAPGDANAIFNIARLEREFNMPTKCVFTFTCRGKKFSESWHSPSALDALTVFGAGEYASLRLDWSGFETQFLRARYSTVGNRFAVRAFNHAQVVAGGGFVGPNSGRMREGVGASGAQAHSAAPALSLLTLRTAADRSSKLFLRGFPDFISVDGGTFTPNADFTTRFQIWANWIKIAPAWGWLGQPAGAPGGNTRYSLTAFTNTAGQITLTAGGNIFAGLVDQNVPIRIRGLVNPFRFLNGPMTVKPSSATVAASIRVMPWPAGSPVPNLAAAQVYLQIGPTVYPATSMGVSRIVSRDTGGNPDPSRGRRPNRRWS